MFAFEKSVGAVVFRRQDNPVKSAADHGASKIKYLVVQYRNGHWEFPRGHQEEGETDRQTAEREIFEETGISELEMVSGFCESTYFFYVAKGNEREERKAAGDGIYIFKKAVFFLAQTKTIEIRLSFEQLNFEWLEFGDALEKVTHEKAKNVLKKADAFLKSI